MGSSSTTHKFSGGRLIADHANTNSPATDCGGTQLGTVQNLWVQANRREDPIIHQEFGMSIGDLLLLDTEWILTATFTGWDEEAISRIFYGGATNSGVPTIADTDANYGQLAGAVKSTTLMWLPNDEGSNPALIVYRALPYDAPKVYFSGRKPLVVKASWLCTRNSSGLVLKSQLLSAF